MAKMTKMKVNFHERFQPENQIECIEDAIFDALLITDGKYTGLLKKHFLENSGIERILFTPSATSALELSVSLLKLKPGDEVIIPSYNFPSAANAVLRFGATVVLCDVDPLSKNISLEDAASKVTKKTRAIIPTHYAGISCDMDSLMDIANASKATVIEDAAQAVSSSYKSKPLGTIGDFGAFSFHHTKVFSCGEGGAFLCRSKKDMGEAEIGRDNGTDKARFYREKRKSYSWQTPGSNHMMSEVCAALLFSQLSCHDAIIQKRKAIHDIYRKIFDDARSRLNGRLSFMEIQDGCEPNYHICYINCADQRCKDYIKDGLIQAGIDARQHFVPLHISDYGRSLGYKAEDFPGSIAALETTLRLPVHTQMSEDDAVTVAEHVIRLSGGI